ncbi:MAG: Uma2 family endonuclease [Geodermatophilaceae bacterium]|nr:Uma2 family endonuclease [Geodermatophilaceae bacterium]
MTRVMALPFSRPLTADDLDSMPDDGHRYELLDGVLIVSPSPSELHQRVVGQLHLLLQAARPADFEVFVAPLDVLLAPDTVVIPDLLVTERIEVPGRRIVLPPRLAIEVLSPSSRRIDMLLKRSRLEAAGVPSYWVVDPLNPRLIAWELRDEVYVEVADVSGAEAASLTAPFPVTVIPSRLVTV